MRSVVVRSASPARGPLLTAVEGHLAPRWPGSVPPRKPAEAPRSSVSSCFTPSRPGMCVCADHPPLRAAAAAVGWGSGVRRGGVLKVDV